MVLLIGPNKLHDFYFGSCYQSARLLSSLWKTYTTERTYWKREAIRRTIYSVFQINVMEDKESMHPKYVCNPCRCFLYRCKSKGPLLSIKIKPFAFNEHSAKYEVCYSKAANLDITDEKIKEIKKLFSTLDYEDQMQCATKVINNIQSVC